MLLCVFYLPQEPPRVFAPSDLELDPSHVAPPADTHVLPLICHCQICHAGGCPMAFRALCAKCGYAFHACLSMRPRITGCSTCLSLLWRHRGVAYSLEALFSPLRCCSGEAVSLGQGEIQSGRSTFRSLLELRVACFICEPQLQELEDDELPAEVATLAKPVRIVTY